MMEPDLFTIFTDGAARGNPGPAAFAFVISRPGQLPVEEHGCLGDTTNNVAEYTALVKALQRAQELGGRRIHVHSDSELMIKQMLGQYKVKHEGLRPLYKEAKGLAADFDAVTFSHVRREQNRRADELCNEALDGAPRQESKQPQHAEIHSSPAHGGGHRKTVRLPAGSREEILDCLRSVACVWSAGNPNHPRPEEVWDQLWTILEDAGVLKAGLR
jgi:ribonuclease HI